MMAHGKSALLVLLLAASIASAVPLGNSFTYQGQLSAMGQMANGTFDFQFSLTDAEVDGNVVATIEIAGVEVSQGAFTVELDFGAGPFAGDQLWLEIGVKEAADLVYDILSPRQRINPVPYAIHSKFVDPGAVGADEVNPNQVQLRVFQSCFGGSKITSIAANGTVTCDSDDTATWVAVNSQQIYTQAHEVGVNTTSPQATLHVRDFGTTVPAFHVEGASGTEGDITWPPDETLHMGTWDGVRFDRRMQIHRSGTVFIDHDLAFDEVPGDKISLFGDRLGQSSMYGFGIADQTMYYKADGAHSWLISNNSGASPEMHLTATGLGVGTSAPNHELVVQGNEPTVQIRDDGVNDSANAARLELLEQAGGAYDGGAFFHWDGELNRLFIGTKVGGVDNPNQLVIDRSSNSVGIGTQVIDTNHRLSVNGSIRATEIVVETGWADFVFEEGYRLRPLDEVKAFIRQHGHLPDVPSAADVAKNGVALGAMEATLLQKIEELTLYTIELNARIAELEARRDGGGS